MSFHGASSDDVHAEMSEILARSRQKREETNPSQGFSMPRVGLLTQTVISSPTIQHILPARIRSKYHNDVVFVAERSIFLREAREGLYLEEVAIKSDFDATIVAAKTIKVSSEPSWVQQMKSSEVDDDKYEGVASDLLVLTLDSKELVFLYYRQNSVPEDGKFIHFRKPLPPDVSALERFGRYLAIDTRSRAIAVAPPSGYFGLFTMKSCQELRSQVREGNLSPIDKCRFYQVEGDILFMDFLHPPNTDEDRIILVLVLARRHHIHILSYDWHGLDSPPRLSERRLPADFMLPNILIPLTKPISFVMINNTSVVLFDNVLESEVRNPEVVIPLALPHQESGRYPLYTQWARPFRNEAYKQHYDNIYLCSEDGLLFYLEIGHGGVIERQTRLGQLNCDVDAAFDVLDFGFKGGDVLLVAGSMGGGGLYLQKARQRLECVQRFANWTPTMDSVTVPANKEDGYKQNEQIADDIFFVCSGSTNGKGAVVQLRHGIEAPIGFVMALDGSELKTRNVWAMSTQDDSRTYLLTSNPVSSTVLLHSPENDEFSEVDESAIAFDFASPTLAAGIVLDGVMVQVTSHAINLSHSRPNYTVSTHSYGSGQSAMLSVVYQREALITSVVREADRFLITVNRVLYSDGTVEVFDVAKSADLDHEPTAISMENMCGEISVIVGTSDARVIIYGIVGTKVLPVSECVLQSNGDEISQAVESIITLGSTRVGISETCVLFCGLRGGELVGVSLHDDRSHPGSKIVLRQGSLQNLGQTVVELNSIESRPGCALVSCANNFWYLSHVSDRDTVSYVLQNIWITDQNKAGMYHQKSVESFLVIGGDLNTANSSLVGSLICICEGELLVCRLEQHARTVPYQINFPGTVNRVAYSRYLRSLVVAYSTMELDLDTDPIKRYVYPHLGFIDLESYHSDDRNQASQEEGLPDAPWRPQGPAGERITCILDWTPKRKGEEYHFIVIGTAHQQQKENGRVIFLRARRTETDHKRIECSVKYIHKFEHPVRALASYGDCTLMVATGNEIVPLAPKFSDRQWPRGARFRLTSPGVFLTVREPFLYVSTARDTLVILRIDEDKLKLYAYDRVKRDGLCHHYIGGDHGLLLAASRGGTISLLSEKGITDRDKMLRTALAEAHLPFSVIRLTPSSTGSTPQSSVPTIMGTTRDGTVYAFIMLSELEWRLLKFLQNLCISNPDVCPFTSERKLRWVPIDIEPSIKKPSSMHVNGDVLSRLLARGPEYVEQLLHTSEVRDSFSDAQPHYRQKFNEYAADIFGPSDDLVHQVFHWMTQLLRFNV